MISLDNVEHLLIYFEKLKGVDSSFVHSLCAAYRYCKRSNKRLTLIGNESETIRKFISSSDFIDVPTCISKCLDKCLWS
jgi:anti-anti-sigma regulatory factor